MNDPILLDEHQDWRGPLAEEDALYLSSTFPRQFSVRRDVTPAGQIVINPAETVGVLTLPSGRRLEARPKVRIGSVFYMLSRVWDLQSPFRDEFADYHTFDTILEAVADYFVTLTYSQIDRGLFRNYIEVEENLPFVRGRILIAQDVRLNFAQRHRTYCRYPDFTWDIPENQVIRQVVHELSGWPFSSKLRQRLASLDSELAEISPTRHGIQVFDSFHYHRHNDTYQEIHGFCRLFMNERSLDERAGERPFQTFLVDMNQLFEAYATKLATEAFAGSGLWVVGQWGTDLDVGSRVHMRPDIAVLDGGRPVLIADAKYKRTQSEEFVHPDLYQVLAYCVAESIPAGLLLYPKHEAETSDVVVVRGSGTAIRRMSIDLDGTLADIEREESRVGESLRELLKRQAVASAAVTMT